MPRFFIDDSSTISGEEIVIRGESSRHISRSLRMKVGEKLDISDFSGYIYNCEIVGFTSDDVLLKILCKEPCRSEPNIKVRVFQALPKGDKFDTVIQKCTELGAYDFTPVITSRCISRPDLKSAEKKRERWQKISQEAAKQSERGIIPQINPICNFEKALLEMSECSVAIMCYECEDGNSIRRYVSDNSEKFKSNCSVAVFIGPEGGIAPQEIAAAKERGITTVGLGKRILRTETAPLLAVSAILLLTNNYE